MSKTTDRSNATGEIRKPSSARRIAASRANGAKSKGPVTPEGKARSSANSRTHGLLSSVITLTPEEEVVYDRILDNYVLRFDPRDQAEHDLIEEIVFCKYQMRQAWAMQTSALGIQIAVDREVVDSEWLNPSDLDRRVLALGASLKDGNTIPLLQRYARSLSTQAERAMKTLTDLRKQRVPPVSAPARQIEPNEPDVELEPEDSTPGGGLALTHDTDSQSEPNEPDPAIEHPETADDDAQYATISAYLPATCRSFRLRTPRAVRCERAEVPLARAA